MKKIDLTGKHFGYWTVLYESKERKNNQIYWHCRCDCGNEKDVNGNSLRNGHSQSCGCKTGDTQRVNLIGQTFGELTVLSIYQKGFHRNNNNYETKWLCKCSCGQYVIRKGSTLRKNVYHHCGCKTGKDNFKDITGQRFGKLTVIKVAGKNKQGYLWECLCDCGTIKIISGISLRRGATNSCGCLNSKNNLIIKNLLIENKIFFEDEYIILNKYKMDFFINNQYMLEYDGEGHFFQVGNWNFEKQHQYDLIKNKYCFDNNIPLIRIPYDAEYTIDDLKLETTRFLLTPENEKEYYENR